MKLRLLSTLWVLLAATVALGASCGPANRPPPDDAIEDPIELVGAMEARLEGVQSIRVRAILEYFGEGDRVRIRQAVVARAPSDLRLETISPFDTSLNVLVTNSDRLTFYDIESARFYTGAPTAENVGRLVPLWLTPTDIVRVLMGGPPLDAAASADPGDWELEWMGRHGDEGAYRLRVPVAYGGHLDLFVQHNTWTLSGAKQYDAGGELIYELRTGDFERFEAEEVTTSMPTVLRFLMPTEDIDISLEVEELTLNPELPDVLFELAEPPGAEVIEL